ncbi:MULTISPECIES: group I truncated hemoglobin [Pseudomonas syringae group]|uniref:Group 1 truncated hemoglobin n=2 Tax=Pseudomonas syringae group TaxID=136849 RepID=A0AAW4E1P3_PSESX|nr:MULTISPECIES: group 1 truncated hemoglobin [Pseudomonas syringae group]AVI86272.1 group 1 truncated hemoglobin [Pseudomonas syringae pv. tomato]EEB57673.1 protozoan/cyanobacterial globin family protein [Pseudomonas syringae pv. tomato T1]KGK93002.1 globin [Pseudomonas syringae pv. tomato]KUR39022.1 Group 1 truncated hemoglobin GlbN [Pseudomonas syringae pv. tomato]KUR51066.1 Group 1 truncated hemoglobin GlbN [Pseudomonas syringae pv. tomato]
MRRVLIVLMLTVLASCAQQPARDDSLYQDLGQRAGIQRIVEGMLLNIAKDERIVEHFKKVNIVRLRDKLVEQLCVEAGGPCRYTGDSMAESHKGQNLTPSDFNALVENLIAAMDTENVPVPVQNRLIARLAPMRGEVLGK